jgi:hypothetical protein
VIILGLDQAPIGIGFAYGEPGSVPTRGYHENPNYGDNTGRLSAHVYDWVKTFAKSIGAERAYFEQIVVRKPKKFEKNGRMIDKWALDINILHRQFAVVAGIELGLNHIGLADGAYEVDIADWRREFYAGSRPTRGQGSESEAWKVMSLRECLRRGWLITEELNGKPNHNVAEACAIWFYGCCHADRRFRVAAGIDKRRQQMKADEARREAL